MNIITEVKVPPSEVSSSSVAQSRIQLDNFPNFTQFDSGAAVAEYVHAQRIRGIDIDADAFWQSLPTRPGDLHRESKRKKSSDEGSAKKKKKPKKAKIEVTVGRPELATNPEPTPRRTSQRLSGKSSDAPIITVSEDVVATTPSTPLPPPTLKLENLTQPISSHLQTTTPSSVITSPLPEPQAKSPLLTLLTNTTSPPIPTIILPPPGSTLSESGILSPEPLNFVKPLTTDADSDQTTSDQLISTTASEPHASEAPTSAMILTEASSPSPPQCLQLIPYPYREPMNLLETFQIFSDKATTRMHNLYAATDLCDRPGLVEANWENFRQWVESHFQSVFEALEYETVERVKAARRREAKRRFKLQALHERDMRDHLRQIQAEAQQRRDLEQAARLEAQAAALRAKSNVTAPHTIDSEVEQSSSSDPKISDLLTTLSMMQERLKRQEEENAEMKKLLQSLLPKKDGQDS